jgi:hypothetical protein
MFLMHLTTLVDKKKLYRVLGYLKGTVGTYLKLKPNWSLRVEAYIDASYDCKLNIGVFVYVAGSLVSFSSKTQKCVTKSPTET